MKPLQRMTWPAVLAIFLTVEKCRVELSWELGCYNLNIYACVYCMYNMCSETVRWYGNRCPGDDIYSWEVTGFD